MFVRKWNLRNLNANTILTTMERIHVKRNFFIFSNIKHFHINTFGKNRSNRDFIFVVPANTDISFLVFILFVIKLLRNVIRKMHHFLFSIFYNYTYTIKLIKLSGK